MGRPRKSDESRSLPPATTPEAEENQMIYLATRLAKQQLEDGTASAQLITHYLKLGSSKERLEKEKLIEENKLLRAKTESIKDAAETKQMFADVMAAMKSYAGNLPALEEEFNDE